MAEELSPEQVREAIVTEMARTFFVTSYADAWDRKELPPKAPHAGPGDEWFACAPEETPMAARLLADSLVKAIEEHDDIRLEEVFQKNASLPDGHLCEPTADSFGYCLAMECLGHGVGWADDHPEHGIKLPYLECWLETVKTDSRDDVNDLYTQDGWVFLDAPDGGPLWLTVDHTGWRFFDDEGVPPPFKTVCKPASPS